MIGIYISYMFCYCFNNHSINNKVEESMTHDTVITFLFAVTPSMKIEQVCPTSISVKVSLSPSSAQFKFQHLSLYHRREGTEQWTLVSDNAEVGETICISDLSPEQRYSVKVVASYPDGEDISQELGCDLPKEGWFLKVNFVLLVNAFFHYYICLCCQV